MKTVISKMDHLLCKLFGHRPRPSFVAYYSMDRPVLKYPSDVCLIHVHCEACGDLLEQKTVPHDWGEWTYLDKRSCRQSRTCRNCNCVEENVIHTFGEWEYIRDHSCKMVRYCQRCREKDRKEIEQHEEPVWSSISSSNCTRHLSCPRCRKTFESETEHLFDRHKKVFEGCDVYIHCRRCGKKEFSHTEHQWRLVKEVTIEYRESYSIFHDVCCERCGREERQHIKSEMT